MRLGSNKGFWKYVLAFLVLIPLPSFSAIEGEYIPSRVNNSVKTLVQGKLVERGYSSLDSRYPKTLNKVASKSTALVKASKPYTLLGATGKSWMGGIFKGGLLSRGNLIAFAATGALQWVLMDDDKVEVQVIDTSREVGVAGYYWTIGANDKPTITEIAEKICGSYQYCDHYTVTAYDKDPSRTDLRTVTFYNDATEKSVWSKYNAQRRVCTSTDKIASCLPGYVPETGVKRVVLDWTQAVGGISEGERQLTVSPEVMATIANNVWKQASEQAGYDGIPYSESYPITKNDVATLGSNSPSVGDFVMPDSSLGTDPEPDTGTTPDTSTGDGSVIGTNPEVEPPSLDDVYTGRQVMQPIMDSMPFLRDFQLPERTAVCPTYSFDWNGKTFVADVHCILIDKFKHIIYMICMFSWSFIGIRIVLEA